MAATVPTLTVEIAFTTDPFATPTWTDVSDYVEEVSVRRGKGKVLEAIPAGTCGVTLDNTDGRFDPAYTSGAYYPDVKPFRRLRVRATVNGSTYGLFSGFITAWPQAYEWPDISTAQVEAVDAFQILNLRSLTATYSQELSSARVAAVLDDLSWPAGDRDIDTGQTTVQAATLDDDNPLSHLQKVADSENGLVFIDRDGAFAFRSRHGLIAGTFDDTHIFGDGEYDVAGDGSVTPVAVRDVTVNFDDLDIWNDVRVSSQGVAEQTASDADSQAAYLTRTLSRTGMLLTSISEQQDHATYLLTGYREPAVRVDQIVHDGVLEPAEWEAVLDRDLGDKVTVYLSPPGGGELSQRSFVEGVDWSVVGDRWSARWRLTPATRRLDFWLVGDSVQGVLGETTRLAY